MSVHGHIIAVDVGGTGIKAALLDGAGQCVRQSWQATGREHGAAAVVRGIVDLVDGMQQAAARSGTPAAAVGLALPGIVDEPAGVGVWSATIGWRDAPFRKLVAERTGLPVAVGHDVRAGGLAEARLGAGVGHDHFLFVPIGTSIAAAVMNAGRAQTGAHHRAGEIGHIPVRPDGELCPCGARGCAERYASAAAVGRRHTAAGGASADPTEVARLAATGDPTAGAVWDEAVSALADMLLISCAVLDPELVVLGGGLAESGDLLLTPLRAALAERARVQVPPRLARARLGERAGCLGAGLLAADLVAGGVPR